jgi:hypothetical protein
VGGARSCEASEDLAAPLERELPAELVDEASLVLRRPALAMHANTPIEDAAQPACEAW